MHTALSNDWPLLGCVCRLWLSDARQVESGFSPVVRVLPALSRGMVLFLFHPCLHSSVLLSDTFPFSDFRFSRSSAKKNDSHPLEELFDEEFGVEAGDHSEGRLKTYLGPTIKLCLYIVRAKIQWIGACDRPIQD